MNKTLEKRLDSAESLALSKLEDEVREILERYGNDNQRIIKESTSHEKDILIRWNMPAIKEYLGIFMDVFFPGIMKIVLETRVYPYILSPDKSSEDPVLVACIDSLYDDTVNADLMHKLKEEFRKCPDPSIDPEGCGNWRASPEICEEMRKARAKLDDLKDRIRAELAVEAGTSEAN